MASGSYAEGEYCPASSTQSVEFYFSDGSWNSEFSYEMFDSSGASVMVGRGSGTYDVIVNGVTYTDGDLWYTAEVPQGNDCDDTDPLIKHGR